MVSWIWGMGFLRARAKRKDWDCRQLLLGNLLNRGAVQDWKETWVQRLRFSYSWRCYNMIIETRHSGSCLYSQQLGSRGRSRRRPRPISTTWDCYKNETRWKKTQEGSIVTEWHPSVGKTGQALRPKWKRKWPGTVSWLWWHSGEWGRYITADRILWPENIEPLSRWLSFLQQM